MLSLNPGYSPGAVHLDASQSLVTEDTGPFAESGVGGHGAIGGPTALIQHHAGQQRGPQGPAHACRGCPPLGLPR